jgi:hypothetical protein
MQDRDTGSRRALVVIDVDGKDEQHLSGDVRRAGCFDAQLTALT